MYCQTCGHEVALGLPACSSCGQLVAQPKLDELGERLMQRARSTSQDAWHALKILALDPVGGLPPASEGLKPEQARNAALAFAMIFDLCVVLGGAKLISFFRGWFFSGASFGSALGLAVAGLVPFLSIFGALTLSRKLFHPVGAIERDLFVAGTVLLPVAGALLLATILGLEVFSIVSAFAVCYVVILLYTGFRVVSGLSPSRAALAVPIVLVVSLWLFKIVLIALL